MVLEWALPCLLLICGGYFTVKTRFFAVRNIGKAFSSILTTKKHRNANISVFSSLCTTLGATVGVGNIVGVASAVTIGGPGTVFWMLISALFAMSVKMVETVLGNKYRAFDHTGNCFGGPFLYIEKGLTDYEKI